MSFPRRILESLRDRPGIRRVFANTAWLSFDKVLRLVIGLLVSVWLARYLGPHTFGQYSYAIALVGLFSVLSTLGLDAVLVRELVKAPGAQGALLGTAFVIRLLGGTVGVTASIVCVLIARPDDTTTQLLVTLIAAGMVVQAIDVIDHWFQSQLLNRYVVFAKGVAFLMASAAKVLLILTGGSVITFAFVGFLELVLAAAGLIVAYGRAGQYLTAWRAKASYAGRLMKPALPLMFAGMAVSLYMRIDQIMLAEMLGDEAVGVYSAAVRLSEATYFIPGVMMASLLPVMISTRSSSRELFLARTQHVFDVMAMVGLGLALSMSMLSPDIVELTYGKEYAASASVLAIHAWATVFVFLGVASGSYLVAENMTAVAFYRTALGAIVNIGLNFLFIPHWGVVGAAYATLISYAVSVYAILFDRRARQGGMMLIRALLPFRLFRLGAWR